LLLVVVELATTDAVHSARDLGALEIALAVGFLTAAVAPERAAALLPMAAALVVALAVVVGVDLAAGRATPGAEAAHMIEVIGVGLLWLVSRPPAWWQARPA
jgi:predicted anti-sigma-YlaC factor YlaD